MYCAYCEEPVKREDVIYNEALEAFICESCNHELNERNKEKGNN